MTALVSFASRDAELFFTAVTSWMDEVFATDYRSHRRLARTDEDMESAFEEVHRYYLDSSDMLDPATQVAQFALMLRCQDAYSVMSQKWQSPAVKASALRALRGIHEHFLGPVPDDRHAPVHFAVSRNCWNWDVIGFIESHRVERDGVFGSIGDTPARCGLTVVSAPRWTWDVLSGLLGDASKEGSIADHYRPNVHATWSDYEFAISAPVRIDASDVDAVLTLWDPADPGNVFHDLTAAATSAALL